MQKPVSTKQTAPTLDAVQLLWSVFRSPAFFLTLALLSVFWVFLGTQIPQNQALIDLAEEGSFRWAQLVVSFGLNDVYTSWVLGGLGVLAGLSALAMIIDSRGGSRGVRGAWRSGNRWPRESLTLETKNISALKELIERELGLGPLREKGAEWRLERGLFLESFLVMALGVVTVGITTCVFMTQSVSGRVEIVPDDDLLFDRSMNTTAILKEGKWEKANLPLYVACSHGKREDPFQTRTCRVETPRGEVEGEIAIGRPFVSSGLSIRLEKIERSRGDEIRTFVTSRKSGETGWRVHPSDSLVNVKTENDEDAAPLLLQARGPASPAWLQDGEGGPLWVLEGISRPSNEPAMIGVESGEILTLVFHETRYRIWFIWGFALFVVGILSCWLMPHVAVSLSTVEGGGCRVEIGSLNRPGRPRRLISILQERSGDEENEGGDDA